MSLYVINDISTDCDHPPMWTTIKKGNLPEGSASSIRYYYHDVKPLIIPEQRKIGKQEIFQAALAEAQSAGRWKLTRIDQSSGIIEGFASSKILGFKDDFVIRLIEIPASDQVPASLRLDMRSASRIGQGDMGVNASRIKAYIAGVSRRLGVLA